MEHTIILIIASGVVALLFCFLMEFRNNLIFKHRTKKIGEVSAQAKQLIKEGREDFLKPYEEYEKSPSYNKMMWQLNKWRYSDFYR